MKSNLFLDACRVHPRAVLCMCRYVSINDGLLPEVLEVTQAKGLESACKESRWGLRMQLKSPPTTW